MLNEAAVPSTPIGDGPGPDFKFAMSHKPLEAVQVLAGAQPQGSTSDGATGHPDGYEFGADVLQAVVR